MRHIQAQLGDFTRLLLPETLKAVHSGDAAVLGALAQLGALHRELRGWHARVADEEQAAFDLGEFETSYEADVSLARAQLAELDSREESVNTEELGWEEDKSNGKVG